MKKYSYTIPLYYGKLDVIIADVFSEAVAKYNGEKDRTEVDSWEAFASIWDLTKDTRFKIFIRPTANPAVIAHESAHIVNRLFKNIHIDLDYDNDEAFCYMLGWVVKQVHISLDKYNKKC